MFDQLDDRATFSGFLTGMILGGVLTLLRGPRLPWRRLGDNPAKAGRKLIMAITPTDPIRDSIAEGKEAARKRRADLGLPR